MMSEQEFNARLEAIRLEAASRREDVVAYEDQEMGRLFDECKWTQEQIAARMGKTQQWVAYRLRLRAFLDWITTTCCKVQFPVEKLTEGRFRTAWSNTRGKPSDQESRFARCLPLLAQAMAAYVPRGYRNLCDKPGIRKAVIELMRDGKRRNVAQMAEVLDGKVPGGITTDQVSAALQSIQKKPPRGYTVDARHIGRMHQYRFTQKTVPTEVCPVGPDEAGALVAEILPVCREMQAELRKPEASMSTGFLMERLSVIERALSRLLVPAEVA